MIENCLKGEHTLESIMELSHWDGSAQVLRWCSVCGAVVVDQQIDKRIYPGRYVPMKFPKLFKDKFDDTTEEDNKNR